jgi:hypothetical protein
MLSISSFFFWSGSVSSTKSTWTVLVTSLSPIYRQPNALSRLSWTGTSQIRSCIWYLVCLTINGLSLRFLARFITRRKLELS